MTDKIHLKHTHIIVLCDKLREAYNVGAGAYNEPWTDELVMKSCIFPLNIGHVKRLRLELFGPFSAAGQRIAGRPKDEIFTRLDGLENAMIDMVGRLQSLEAFRRALE